jgi:iron complex transport system substrate-binding protein
VAALSPLLRQHPVDWIDGSWPLHDGTLEGILALKPDLVITGQYNAPLLRSRLMALGVPVEILPLPTTLAEVTDYEKRLLTLLDLPPSSASQPPPALPIAVPARRLLLLGANGIGTGRATFEDGILQRAGWTNYLSEGGYQRLDLERIASDPPDAVLWTAPAGPALANRFANHPVLRRAVPPQHWLATEYWRWQCPGPWTWDLIGQLHQWIE